MQFYSWYKDFVNTFFFCDTLYAPENIVNKILINTIETMVYFINV